MSHRLTAVIVTFALAACADAPGDDGQASEGGDGSAAAGAYVGHEVAEDLVESGADAKGDAVTSAFDRNWVISDDFLLDTHGADTAIIQQFFEQSPYGTRSWMADYTVNGESAAQAFVDAALRYDLNPIVLLARAQVEQGIVSKTERPSQSRLDWAFGCGCPDGRSCYEQFRGFSNQVLCSAQTLRKLYDASVTGEGQWVAGRSKLALDGIDVRPGNHATAALYAYTPWILRGRGGNWLVWNVTKKFVAGFEDLGVEFRYGCVQRTERPFIGDGCGCDADCAFVTQDGAAWCHQTGGFCTTGCDGGCPDLSGRAGTFCIGDGGTPAAGICVSTPHTANGQCGALSGTAIAARDRFVDRSGAAVTTREVCAPAP